MSLKSLGWPAIFLAVFLVTTAAVWLQASADEPTPIRKNPQPRPPDPEVYMNGLRSDQEAPVGTPEVLPLTTTLLSPADIQSALAIVHDNDELLGRLGYHRYEVVEAEVCDPKDGECSRLGIFDYDAGVCLHVFINRSSESVDDVIEGSCSPSNGEIEQARLIAESDPRVQEVLDVYEDARYIEWARAWVPRAEGAEVGHRYVAVRWNLDGDTVVAEFIVDLTTGTVCYEC